MSNAVNMGSPQGAAYVVSFENLRMTDVESVGGKNASLGEMISQLAGAGVRVPGGFATTAQAFRDFLEHSTNGSATLAQRIADRLVTLDIEDVRALAQAGAEIRQWIIDTPFKQRNVVCSAIIGHRRRLAGCFLCRSARNFPQRGRHRQRARGDETGVRFAVQRSRHFLSRSQGLYTR